MSEKRKKFNPFPRRDPADTADRTTKRSSKFWEDSLPLFVQAIAAAEVAGQGKPGHVKLDIAARAVNALVDIPVIPEFIEQWLIRHSLTLLVQLANRMFGRREWAKALLAAMNLDEIAAGDVPVEWVTGDSGV